MAAIESTIPFSEFMLIRTKRFLVVMSPTEMRCEPDINSLTTNGRLLPRATDAHVDALRLQGGANAPQLCSN